jgi:hypothetical protein
VFDILQYFKLGGGKELKEIENRKICYIPLHVFPEAVTDYWVDNEFHSMHLLSLKSIVNKLVGLGYIVVLKEHPFNLLRRPRKEYQAVQGDGVLILQSHVDVSLILGKAELVVVWNGSTGIELCATQNKVAFVVKSYYNQITTCNFNAGESVVCLSEDEKINIIRAAVRSSIRVG